MAKPNESNRGGVAAAPAPQVVPAAAPAAAAPAPQVEGLAHAETIVAKLSVKTMGCNAAAVKGMPEGQKAELCRIYGMVMDVEQKEDKFKEGAFVTKFQGTFEGINLETGEIFRSGVLYLPAGISETMEAAFKQIQLQDKTAQVQFAFEIRSVKAGNPIGYSYEAQAIRRPSKDDPLAELRQSMLSLPTAGEVLKSGKGNQLTDGRKTA